SALAVAAVPPVVEKTKTINEKDPQETVEPKVESKKEDIVAVQPAETQIAETASAQTSPHSEASQNSNANETAKKAIAAAAAAPAAQSASPYGKPTGKTRSYLDLRQTPGNKPPQYPQLARRNSQEGQVQLAYYVKNDGTISSVKMIRSSGHPLLDQEAIRAISQYRYQPGQEGWTVHPVNFHLQGPVKEMPSRLRTSGNTSPFGNVN
ncbi:MAG: energy transducer TonB, partial [Bdellovibrionales bacterium]|nr:energy transducer TonB [Bdellovibrionales bacterium]